MNKLRTLSGVGMAVLVGCAASTSYVYAPQDASYVSNGYPAAMTRVPPEEPQGKVEVTSFGIVDITPDGVAPVSTLHVRLAISNDGDATPWTVVTSDQQIEIPGAGRSAPIYVNANAPGLPTVTVPERERRILDLYYPLPSTVADEDDLPAFDVMWQVTTELRPFASRTHFERLDREPPATTSVGLYSGWGPYWWYDPFYPRAVFVHQRPIVIHGPGRPHYHPRH